MNLESVKKIIQEIVQNTLAPHIEPILPQDINDVLNVGDKAFGTFMGHSNTVSKHPNINLKKETDWDKSIKLVVDNSIVGYYLLSDKKTINDFILTAKSLYSMKTVINDKELLEYSKNNLGTQCLSVGILPEYKNKGYSKLLFDYPTTLNYSYVWAVQTKGMSNLNNWLKRAKLVLTFTHEASEQEFYITVEKL